MTALFALLACLFFALAVVGWSAAYVEKRTAATELAAVKKVGKWYEQRVLDLEEETRQLAGQVIASGGVGVAMPSWPGEPDAEYAYDPTGLVRERLDPRDVPVA